MVQPPTKNTNHQPLTEDLYHHITLPFATSATCFWPEVWRAKMMNPFAFWEPQQVSSTKGPAVQQTPPSEKNKKNLVQDGLLPV